MFLLPADSADSADRADVVYTETPVSVPMVPNRPRLLWHQLCMLKQRQVLHKKKNLPLSNSSEQRGNEDPNFSASAVS